jgi:hypothetical protein
VRDILARANLPDHRIAHQLSAVRPRLGTDGKYRRSGGEHIGVEAVASLLLANERAKHAPQATRDVTSFLVTLQQQIVAERARQQTQAPRMDELLSRLGSPLDKVVPGR